MFATVRIIVTLVIVLVVAAGAYYITGLRADLAVSQENAQKLSDAILQQQEVIQQIQADQTKIREVNEQLQTTIKTQNRDLASLQSRFDTNSAGAPRDIGKDALRSPAAVERAINRGTVNAFRCIEIASGSPLTEDEKNANDITTINKECPGLANPNYKPATN